MVGLIFLNLISLVQVLESTWARIIKYIFLKKVSSFIHNFFFFCHKLGNYSDGLLWKFEKINISILLLFSRSVMSDFLWPYGLQQARLPCPSPSAGVFSTSCPLSQWWYPTISFSVVPFSFCLQSFPASGSFPMSWFLASCDQSIGVLASASVLPMNIQDWFPLRWTGWISLSPRDSQESSPTPQFKGINSLALSL